MDQSLFFSLPILFAGITLVAAGAIQGATGFGFNMLAAPILAVIDAKFVPAPMLMMAMVVSFGGMLAERRDIDMSGLRAALIGRVLASVAAVVLLSHLDQRSFSIIFGVAVLLAVLVSLTGLRFSPTPIVLLVAGSVSGLMGTLTSIGAPPMALAFQNARGPVMRSTLNSFFVVGAAISLFALWFAGYVHAAELFLALTMLPFALLGFVFSGWGKSLVDRGHMRMVVFAISSISAIILIARAI
ncbi:MAG: sulfite exporter TauE/SafE family protein [Phyllobacterium sp.]